LEEPGAWPAGSRRRGRLREPPQRGRRRGVAAGRQARVGRGVAWPAHWRGIDGTRYDEVLPGPPRAPVLEHDPACREPGKGAVRARGNGPNALESPTRLRVTRAPVRPGRPKRISRRP
jgi:hypothetical protein